MDEGGAGLGWEETAVDNGPAWRSEMIGRQPAMYQFLTKFDCKVCFR